MASDEFLKALDEYDDMLYAFDGGNATKAEVAEARARVIQLYESRAEVGPVCDHCGPKYQRKVALQWVCERCGNRSSA